MPSCARAFTPRTDQPLPPLRRGLLAAKRKPIPHGGGEMAFLDSVMVTIGTAQERADRFEANAERARAQGCRQAAAFYAARAEYARAEAAAMLEAVKGL